MRQSLDQKLRTQNSVHRAEGREHRARVHNTEARAKVAVHRARAQSIVHKTQSREPQPRVRAQSA